MAEGGYALDSKSTIEDVKDTCSVCLEIIRNSRSLPCGHRFCALCLLGYIEKCLTPESSDSFPCALCRAGIHVSNYKMSSEKNDISKLDLLSFSQISDENESRCKVDDRCQPCKRGQENVKGAYFCSDCNECICIDCVTHHSRNKLTVNHTVRNIESEKNDQIKQGDSNSNLIAKCMLHNKKQFKYICNDHCMLCCSKCVIESHRNCINIDSITKFSKSSQCDEMIKQVRNLLHSNLRDGEVVRKKNLETLMSVDVKMSTCSNTFAAIEKEMHDAVSKIIKSNEKSILEMLSLQKEKSSQAIQTVLDLQGKTRENTTCFDQLEKSSDPCHYVTVMMNMLKRLEDDRQIICDLSDTLKRSSLHIEVEIEPFTVYINQRLQTAFHRLSSDECILMGHNKNERPKLVAHSAVEISAMSILQSGNVVIIKQQSDVYLLDSKLHLLRRMNLSSQPAAMTRYTSNSVIISLPNEQRMAILIFNERKKTVSLSYVACERYITCITLDTFGLYGLIVAYCSGNRDFLYQKVTSSMDDKWHRIGYKAANDIQDISVDASAQIIYFSQYKVNRITGINFEGQAKFAFIHPKLHTPMGLVLAKPDTLYVSCNGTQQISEITISKRELKDVICRSEGLKGPVAVTFDNTLTRCLVYDNDKGMQLKLFDMNTSLTRHEH